MNFTRIDLEYPNRREHFALYRQQIKCGFSLTTKLRYYRFAYCTGENRL